MKVCSLTGIESWSKMKHCFRLCILNRNWHFAVDDMLRYSKLLVVFFLFSLLVFDFIQVADAKKKKGGGGAKHKKHKKKKAAAATTTSSEAADEPTPSSTTMVILITKTLPPTITKTYLVPQVTVPQGLYSTNADGCYCPYKMTD